MKGLEISEAKEGSLERTKRLDAEFFLRAHVDADLRLRGLRTETIPQVSAVSDGNHFSISEEFADEGVPYYRGQDVVGHFFVEQAQPRRITQKAFEQDHMKRSHLRKGDVLLSIVGTIGELSLVKTVEEATCSCKLAILRPKSISPEYLAAFLTSRIGRLQTERWKRGAVQMGLLLEDMDQIIVPRWRNGLEDRIACLVNNAYSALEKAEAALHKSEKTLMEALGLDHWQPPEPLTYTRKASDVFNAGRFDSEHFHPKFDALRDLIRARILDVIRLGGAIEPVINGFDFRDFVEEGTPYIRVGDVRKGIIDLAGAQKVPITASSITKDVGIRIGDVLFTRKGSYGNAAHVRPGQEKAIISSEIMRIRLRAEWRGRILPEVLATYLNSLAGKYQAEK
ncbi:MAG: hypothetical protein KJ726_06705, partial [Verrucomicrobia bacterium]|nr:hypothetical protein [Verrucomicrobiota bacterium]